MGFAEGYLQGLRLRRLHEEAKLQKQEADAKTRYYDALFAKAQMDQRKLGEELLDKERLRFARRQAGAAGGLLQETPTDAAGPSLFAGGLPSAGPSQPASAWAQVPGGGTMVPDLPLGTRPVPRGGSTPAPGGAWYSAADRAILSSPTPTTGVQLDPESRAQLQQILQRQRAADPDYAKNLQAVDPGKTLVDPVTNQAVFTAPSTPASDVGKLLADQEAYVAQGRTEDERRTRAAVWERAAGASDQLPRPSPSTPGSGRASPDKQKIALLPRLIARDFDFTQLDDPYADLSQGVKDRLKARGITKPTAADIATALREEATERAQVSAAQGTAKPLSVDEASRMGVPAGTTAGELRSQGTVPPLHDEAAKAYQLGRRMAVAHDTLSQLEAQGVAGTAGLNAFEEAIASLGGGAGVVIGTVRGGFAGGAAGGAAGLGVGNLAKGLLGYLRSPEEQRYLTAQLAFIAGILRKESGAAITREEYLQYGRIYFPQLGDDPQTVQYKAALRQQEIAALQEQFPNRPFPHGPQPQEAEARSPQPPQPLPEQRQAPAASAADRQALKPGINPTVAALLRQRTPEQIVRMQDGQLRGITSPDDIPGLSAAQRQALALKLAGMRSRRERTTAAGVPR